MLYGLITAGLFIAYLVYTLWSRDQTIRRMEEERAADQQHALAMLTRVEERHNNFLDGILDRTGKERQLLLNRIQDPQFAVGQAAALSVMPGQGMPMTKPFVTADDDADFWKGQREMSGEE